MNTVKLPIKYQLRLGHLLAELAGSELIETVAREDDQNFCEVMSEYFINSAMSQLAELCIPYGQKDEFLKYRQKAPQQAAQSAESGSSATAG